MHAQVTRVQFQSDRVNEAIAVFRDSVVPAAREQQGFQAAYLLVDRDASSGIVVSLWETEADVAALAAGGVYQAQVAKVAAFLAGPPERAVYEVSVQA